MADTPRSAHPEEPPSERVSEDHFELDEGPATDLADFTPVPRRMNRGDVWTDEVQRAFIEALADLGSVEAACRAVGRSPASAYRLRRHPLGGGFAGAWQRAVEFGVKRIEDYAMDRALNGAEVPVFLNGGQIVMRRVHNDRLVMFMLRAHAPERYCSGGGAKALNAVDKRMLERFRQECREEWEREDDEEEQETLDSIDRFIDTMRGNRLTNMSPAERERRIAADAQARADKAAGWHPGMAYGEFAVEAATLLPRFIAEVEAEWPPLEPWAWEDPEGEDEDEAPPALPPPAKEKRDEPEEPGGPRVRTMKDEGW